MKHIKVWGHLLAHFRYPIAYPEVFNVTLNFLFFFLLYEKEEGAEERTLALVRRDENYTRACAHVWPIRLVSMNIAICKCSSLLNLLYCFYQAPPAPRLLLLLLLRFAPNLHSRFNAETKQILEARERLGLINA